ncbi:MAG: PilZ domain-containing protein [Nitrospira sp.]|nr:PilZ domain-containing protein [Candidatus Brocadiales bacterium]MBL7050087.1 PilZ domain-containing protein [Nitrospira sp.]
MKLTDSEKREYFRVDDIISVVASPINAGKMGNPEQFKAAMGSKVLPLGEARDESASHEEIEYTSITAENRMLFEIISEMKSKLDFIINHFILEREGLLSPEKKPVNISASGVRFTVDYPVKVNDIMEVKLLLPTHPPVAVLAYGEVIRADKINDNTYEVALEYLNMGESAKDKIIQYTMDLERESIRKQRESQ